MFLNNKYKSSVHSIKKRRNNFLWVISFYFATLITVLILITLMLRILDDAFGFVATRYTNDPTVVLGTTLENATELQLRDVFKKYVSKGIYRRFNNEKNIQQRNKKDLQKLVDQYVIKKRIDKAWTLSDSIFKKKSIEEYIQNTDDLQLEFRKWISFKFLISSQASNIEIAGIRTALFGTLWLIVIAVVFSIPFGIATAVYLEEYAPKTKLTQIIRINIYNLAGIPSIVYGLLGLTVFVRLLEPITQGRTILSGGLTLGLMCLPIIIINSQEAIRAVPNSLRDSSYAVGATKWQTIWHNVLPYSLERILTGIILAVSRAVGETAPLVVVGSATFISIDPRGIFSRFTALPIQIYQWASRPQEVYQHGAAAAVISLIVLIFILNGAIFLLRSHLSKQEKL